MQRRGYIVAAGLALAASWDPLAWAQAPGPATTPSDDEVEVQSAPAPAPAGAQAAAPTPAPAPISVPAPDYAALTRGQAESAARIAALEAQLANVSASVAEVRAAPPRPVAEVTTEADPRAEADGIGPAVLPAPGFLLSGYAQGQYVANQVSQDQLQQGGALLNQDQFVLRRARLRADRRWRYAALALELDGNSNGGLNFGVRRAEASLVWDGPAGGSVPLVVFTAGLFYTPFGYELPSAARTRLFMERSLSSTAFFPGQGDVGIRLAGGWRFLRYAVALVNGEPLAEGSSRPFRGDPNAAKDLVGRLGVDASPAAALRIAGGVSLLTGKGFHPGTDATKAGTVWRDLNENGAIDLGEVMAVPGAAATPSKSFSHWAVGVDLRASLLTRLGYSRLFAEATIASNLDRGLFIADPVATGLDVRQFGFNVAVVQDLTPRGFVGFRLDLYNPNADALDSRAGQLLPSSQVVTTLSPLVGVRVGDRTRLTVEYDRVLDKLARDASGVPTDLKNDLLTVRLQVDL